MSHRPPGNKSCTANDAEQHHGRRRAGRRRGFVIAVSASALVIALATVLGLGANASAQVEHSPCSGTPAVSNSTTNAGLIADCNILLAAKPILIGDSTQATLNWSPDVAMFRWDGIKIARTYAHVAEVSLSSNDLSGSIPPELGNLTNLDKLWLSDNELTGSIPPELGNLTNLDTLLLYDNELSGSIPVELGNLTNLTELLLPGNRLSGSIPPELGNLTHLESLWLGSNRLSGSIPPELGNLTKLAELDLSDNELSGSIPDELGNLTSLAELDLSGNDLSGCIPFRLTNVLAGQSLGLSVCCLGSGGGVDVGAATIVVANGWSPADVGAASVLAARTDSAVVTYTAGDELPSELGLLLREASPAEVIIVGGIAAVSRDVCTQIRLASPESDIARITGADRADTAASVARRVLGNLSEAGRVTLIVANGWSPPDIGAAAALAARSGRAAVLYTQRDILAESSAALLRDYDVAEVIMIGGTAAISDDAASQIAAAAGTDASVSRLTGTDRIHTAAEAARRVLGNPADAPDGITLVIANGWSPPDIGVAAALAAATDNSAVAYTAPGTLPEATAALIRDYRPSQVIIVGGRAAVSNDVREAITDAAPTGADVRRITGQTRTDTAVEAARDILADH
ncbi:cell wall-binding repeat-containing protein [Candidatus Poriferisodalis sp.]|uniref:cell wall-binding repeat-containing protein n=1 Tax=Candidatus Poriferisodalis sp. TaxID=3101277 RepID=UPI003AF83B8D